MSTVMVIKLIRCIAVSYTHLSKDEAFRKEKEIKELFPDVSTYVTYNAPFWRLRIGDFRSHEEAYHMQRLLMDAFPAYRKEMYIVREEVKIPLN